MSLPDTRPPRTTDPDLLSAWAEDEGVIKLAVADDETFRRVCLVRLTELSGRVRNLEMKTNSHDQQTAVVSDQNTDTKGNVKAILAVGGAFLTIAAACGGFVAWLLSLTGGKGQ